MKILKMYMSHQRQSHVTALHVMMNLKRLGQSIRQKSRLKSHSGIPQDMLNNPNTWQISSYEIKSIFITTRSN